jgi:hypothetical protein
MKRRDREIETFVSEVESAVCKRGLSYIEAVMDWQEKHGVEPETAAKLVSDSSSLKAKIEAEAALKHLIKKKIRNTLPVD